MKLIQLLLPVPFILAQENPISNDTNSPTPPEDDMTTPLPCADNYPNCAVWVSGDLGCDAKIDIKMNCRKTCNVCDDPSITNMVIDKMTCKDKDPSICSNVATNPSICQTSDQHKLLCPKSCNRCDMLDTNQGKLPSTQMTEEQMKEVKELLEEMKQFEEKGDEELMKEFFTRSNCRDVYPDTCQKLSGLEDGSLGCDNESIKKMCAVTCNTCEEILQPIIEKAKEAADKLTEKAEDLIGKLNSNDDTQAEEEEQAADETSLNSADGSMETTEDNNNNDGMTEEDTVAMEENLNDTENESETSEHDASVESGSNENQDVGETTEEDDADENESAEEEETSVSEETMQDIEDATEASDEAAARPSAGDADSSSSSLVFSLVFTTILSLILI